MTDAPEMPQLAAGGSRYEPLGLAGRRRLARGSIHEFGQPLDVRRTDGMRHIEAGEVECLGARGC